MIVKDENYMDADRDHMMDSSNHKIKINLVEDGKTADCKGTGLADLGEEGEDPVLYSRRWIMVFLFAFYSGSNAFQWIYLNIIGDKITLFYVPSMASSPSDQAIAIDWLSMVYMLGYVIFMLPASWMLDRYGLYRVGVLGTLLNCLGAWIKCVAVDPDRFAVLMLGQCVCSLAQAFILGVPARLAAVWFGPNEVSTATAIGVFGNQIGCALGFLIPPIVVDTPPSCLSRNSSNSNYNNTTNIFANNNLLNNNTSNNNLLNNNTNSNLLNNNDIFNNNNNLTTIYCDDLGHLTSKIRVLFYGNAIVTTALFLLVVFFFKQRPPTAPSRAQMVASLQKHPAHHTNLSMYTLSLVRLITNISFFLLFITYGINVGAYYAIGTLLNPIILYYFPTEHMRAGWIGVTLVLAGVLGSILSGIWLDRTKLFKSTTLVIYCLSCIGMLAFTFILLTNSILLVFIAAFIMGFFMTGYLPVGFEFAAEITFPESEGTSSGLLNASAQVFGIAFTMSVRALPSTFYGNLFLVVVLLLGSVATAFIKTDLRRQKAHERITNICVIQSITTISPDPSS